MSKKLLAALLVSLLILSPIAVVSASELGFQNQKTSHDNTAAKDSKKDHRDKVVRVNGIDDDEEDDDDKEREPSTGTIYSINATGEATKKPKSDAHSDKKNNSKGKDKQKRRSSEVNPASLALRSEVEDSSKGRIKLKILSGTQIGNTTFDIEEGKGKINKKNDNAEFKAEVLLGEDDFELVLKGDYDRSIPLELGDEPASIEFASPQSKLASKWFLSLSGMISIEGIVPPPPPTPPANRTVMTLTKTVNASTTLGNGTLRYLLAFANSGNSSAINVNATDTLPSYVTSVSTNGTVISMAGKTIKFSIGNVSISSGWSIVIMVKVNGTTPDQTILRNNAT